LGQNAAIIQTTQTQLAAGQTTLSQAQTAASGAQAAAGQAQSAASSAQTAASQAQTAGTAAQTPAAQALSAAQQAQSAASSAQTAASQAQTVAAQAQTAATASQQTAAGKFPAIGGTMSGSLAVQGTITASQDITAYSDDRLKNRQHGIQEPLEKVKSLNGFVYEFNAMARSSGFDSHAHIGMSAQEVQKVIPEVVKPAPFRLREGDSNVYSTVAYERMVPLLVEAIKELTQKVDKLAARVGV
jgi:multidrug efflux pump subunit AcrA (membrane-fusion protein)